MPTNSNPTSAAHEWPTIGQTRVVAVIPTFNNVSTVVDVVRGVMEYIGDIIVVIDGSTDATVAALAVLPDITVISLSRNAGKGNALRTGFERAREMGYTHAITIDADGQHRAADIPLFLAGIGQSPQTLWIGNRTIPDGETAQPARSKYGGMWGAWWYRFHTGLTIGDTQCGFRAYPLAETLALGSRANRYDYEQDVLIKAAWSGMPVAEKAIHRVYLPLSERVSHFRPVRDFARLFIVNSRAALIRIFMPWRFIDAPGKNLREKLYHLVMKELKGGYPPRTSALSLSLGVLFGLLPIHGFQVASVLGLSIVFRFSKLLAMLGVSISSAPFLPFWIALGLGIGKVVFPQPTVIHFITHALPHLVSASAVPAALIGVIQWIVGSIILASGCSLLTFAISYPLFAGFAAAKNERKPDA